MIRLELLRSTEKAISITFRSLLCTDCSRRPTSDQALKSRMHLGLWQMNPIAVSGQHPFKRIVEKLTERIDQDPFSPDEASGGFERLGMEIPPEMIASEEKSLTIQ